MLDTSFNTQTMIELNPSDLNLVKSKIKTVSDLNWAWQYCHNETGHWIQFDCNDCLVLEFGYTAYTLTGQYQYQFLEVIDGKVDLKLFRLEKQDDAKDFIKIRRTRDNKRSRNNAHKRHQPLEPVQRLEYDLDLVS